LIVNGFMGVPKRLLRPRLEAELRITLFLTSMSHLVIPNRHRRCELRI
jgi:hypothetical protein